MRNILAEIERLLAKENMSIKCINGINYQEAERPKYIHVNLTAIEAGTGQLFDCDFRTTKNRTTWTC